MHQKLNHSFLLGGVIALGILMPWALPGADSVPGPLVGPVNSSPMDAADVDKYLFIISTSKEMEDLPYGGRQTLFDMLHDGLGHYMRDGDTFGVWTFNSQLNAGEYPMQVWHATNALNLAAQATRFVEGQNYRGRSDLDVVLRGLATVVRAVEDVNIFIISDYKVEMKGTRFDKGLNRIYDERDKESRQEEKPFITTLLARKGALASAAVNLDGEPIPLPTRPPPVKSEVRVEARQPAAPTPAKPRTWTGKPEVIVSKSGTVIQRNESGIIMSGPSSGSQQPGLNPEIAEPNGGKDIVALPEFEQAVPGKEAEAASVTAGTNGSTTASQVPAAPSPQPAGGGKSEEISAQGKPEQNVPVVPMETEAVVVARTETGVVHTVNPPGETSSQTVPVRRGNEERPPSSKEGSLLGKLAPAALPVSARERYDVESKTDQLGVSSAAMTALASGSNQGFRPAFWIYALCAGIVLACAILLVYRLVQRRSETSRTSYITKSLYRK